MQVILRDQQHRESGGDGRARFLASDMTSNGLDRNSIAELILSSSPLIESYLSLDEQLQPNGFDLSLKEAARMTSGGSMGSGPDQRELSDTEILEFDREGWLHLSPGPYLISFNEIVNLPLDLVVHEGNPIRLGECRQHRGNDANYSSGDY